MLEIAFVAGFTAIALLWRIVGRGVAADSADSGGWWDSGDCGDGGGDCGGSCGGCGGD